MNATSADFLDFRSPARPGVMRRAVAFSLALHLVLATAAGLYWHKRVAGVAPRETEVTIEFITESESPVALAAVATQPVEVAPQPREVPAEMAAAPVPVPESPPVAELAKRDDAPVDTAAESTPLTVVAVPETRPSVAAPPATSAVAAPATGSPAVKIVGLPKLGSEGKSKPGFLAQPLYRRNLDPPYPLAARRRRQEGVVLLAVRVAAEGNAVSVSVKQSSGFKVLDDAAMGAVTKWEFEPARDEGRAIESEIEVPVRFRIEK